MIPSSPSGGTVCWLLSFGGVACLIVLCCRRFFFLCPFFPLFWRLGSVSLSHLIKVFLRTFKLLIIGGLVESLSFCLRAVDPLLFHCVPVFSVSLGTQHSHPPRWLLLVHRFFCTLFNNAFVKAFEIMSLRPLLLACFIYKGTAALSECFVKNNA